MENDFFLNGGYPPPPLHFESNPSISTWQQLSSAMEIQGSELNCSSEKSPDCFLNPNWEKSTNDHNIHFDSALSSMVSSPAASNSNNVSNECFVIRELIGKLGKIGNSGEISPHSQNLLGCAAIQVPSYIPANNSTNSSRYSTPMNSPPKPPMIDRLVKENLPSLGKSMPLNSTVAEFSPDPGFAERAAKFSCFGSRSFNGRTSQLGLNNSELPFRSNSSVANGKLPRVSSSPSLKVLGSQMGLQENRNSHHEEFTLSEQIPNGEFGSKASNDLNCRKRKAALKGKAKEPSSSPSPNSAKVAELNDNSNAKRSKPTESNENENVKAEEDGKAATTTTTGDDKTTKTNSKPPEPPKDYIHVRARRGQATDSHSLAERVRREKISERMKLLQDLVPGCNKVTGKALMLDEIINYVQSLQRQVEFLSMKLASVNTRMEFNMDSVISKEIFQSGNQLSNPIFPVDSSTSGFFEHQTQQPNSISNGTTTYCSVDPLDTAALCQNLGMQLPPLNGFSESGSQFPAFGEDDLQTLVQMGFCQNLNSDLGLQPQSFMGSNQASHMKIEL